MLKTKQKVKEFSIRYTGIYDIRGVAAERMGFYRNTASLTAFIPNKYNTTFELHIMIDSEDFYNWLVYHNINTVPQYARPEIIHNSVKDIAEVWEILDRRILIEKTGFYI